MASIKFQIIFGIIVLCAICDFSADGFRFKLPKLKPRSNFGQLRLPASSSRTSFNPLSRAKSSKAAMKQVQRPITVQSSAQPKTSIAGKIAIEAAKAGTLGATLIGAGAAGTAIDMKMRGQESLENANQPQNRAKIDCKTNEYGCMQGMCWSNCGPRLDAGDSCFTVKNVTAGARNIVSCSVPADCDPCWSCARDCVPSLQQQPK